MIKYAAQTQQTAEWVQAGARASSCHPKVAVTGRKTGNWQYDREALYSGRSQWLVLKK